MLNSLFNGLNVSNMNVNVNFNHPGFSNMMNKPQNMNNLAIPGHNSVNTPLLENRYNSSILYKFDQIYINTSYELMINIDFKCNKPKKEFESLNDRYTVTQFIGEKGYKPISEDKEIIGEVVNRKEKYPPIVIILDQESIEERKILDQIIYNGFLIGKYYNHNSFFLVLETSGSKENGEPFTTTFNKEKGLFKKEIFSINFN